MILSYKTYVLNLTFSVLFIWIVTFILMQLLSSVRRLPYINLLIIIIKKKKWVLKSQTILS